MKLLIIVTFLLSILCSSCYAQESDKEISNLKNAAFCQCIYKVFEQDSIVTVNDGSASAYIEASDVSLDSFLKVFEYADQFVLNNSDTYLSKHGASLSILKCNDFLNSEELDDFVVKLIEDEK